MKRWLLIPATFVLDQIAGDPEWYPHPVRLIGFAIARGESAVRRRGQTPAFELCSGAVLSVMAIAASYVVTHNVIRFAQRRSSPFGGLVELLLGWNTLAAANLCDEAVSVSSALTLGDLSLARQRLSRIVGRDTALLDAAEISRAVIETLAESLSDGVIAPLFFLALGGVPLAMAYKAVNTLDSMIGHTDARHFYFGKLAARLDDCANYIPARLTAGAITMAAGPNIATARALWWRDGNKHMSPNAGRPEAAIAGALRVRLGGTNTYSGEEVAAPLLGSEFLAPQPSDVSRAIEVVTVVTLLGVGAATAILLAGRLLRPRGASV
jgi:adenosylcobinamide-phosphate synthase